jgi:Membrane-associated phospholipid phosphatase
MPGRVTVNEGSRTMMARRVRFAVAAGATIVFAVVTQDVVTHGALSSRDVAAVSWLGAHRSGALDAAMSLVSRTGGPSATSVYAAVMFIAYCVLHRVRAATVVATVVFGGALLNVALKHLVERSRPQVEFPLESLTTYGFPSGHAAASTVFGGLLCILAWRSGVRGWSYVAAAAGCVAWIVLVCVSRIYLGLHYPTDLAAGVAESVLWLMIATFIIDRYAVDFRLRARHS